MTIKTTTAYTQAPKNGLINCIHRYLSFKSSKYTTDYLDKSSTKTHISHHKATNIKNIANILTYWFNNNLLFLKSYIKFNKDNIS